MKKRIISILTVLAMFLSLCPVWTLASEPDPAPSSAGDYDTSADTATLPARTAETGGHVAEVTIGETTTSYETLTGENGAWAAVQGKTATLKLLQDVNLGGSSDTLVLASGNLTLAMDADITLSQEYGDLLVVQSGAALTIESGNLVNNSSSKVVVRVGVDAPSTLKISGGTITSSNIGISAYYRSNITISGGKIDGVKTGVFVNGGTLNISGGEITSQDTALSISSTCQASLSGGTFIGGTTSVSSDKSVSDMLAGGYAFQKDGNWLTEDEASAKTLTGTITVVDSPKKVSVTTVSGTEDYPTIDAAWTAAQGVADATITLLGDVTASSPLTISGGKITLDCGSFTLTGTGQSDPLITVSGGTLAIANGTIDGGLHVTGGTVKLTGGTYSSIKVEESGKTCGNLLGEGDYCYLQNGNPVDIINNPPTELTNVTVRKCEHIDRGYQHIKDTNQHEQLTCAWCGQPGIIEDCSFDSTAQKGTCSCCGNTADAVASVTPYRGGTTSYYFTIDDAWTAAGKSRELVTITLLSNVEARDTLTVESGNSISFNGDGYTLTGGLVVQGSGLSISSGTFSSITTNGEPFASLLTMGCCYYQNNEPLKTSDTTTVLENVTVDVCRHKGATATPNSYIEYTHTVNCSYCDFKSESEDCTFESVDSERKGTCICGTEAAAEASVTIDGVTKYYPKLKTAINAVRYAEPGSTVNIAILTDLEEENDYLVLRSFGGSQITLDGCGHTLSGYTLGIMGEETSSGMVNLIDCKIDGRWCSAVDILGAKVRISGCEFTSSDDAGLYLQDSDVKITSGTFTGMPAIWIEGEVLLTPADLLAEDSGYFLNDERVTDGLDGKTLPAGFDHENRTSHTYEVRCLSRREVTLSLTASPASLTGGGTVTLTLGGLPAGETVSVTCSGGIPVTAGEGGVWTAVLPNRTASYTFTAAFAGSAVYQAAEASCVVTVEETAVPPDNTDSRLEVKDGITEVPEGLRDIPALNTPEKLELHMRTMITQASPDIPEDRTAVYDVTLQISNDGGKTWIPATKDNFPAGGLSVTLPYPAGTDSSYTFTVVHMFTTRDFGKTPGDTETPAVTNTENGVRFTVTGLSPISVGWTAPASKPGTPSAGGGGGGGGASRPSVVQKPDVEEPKPLSDGFADLGGVGMWYYDAVEFVLQKGLMNGFSSTLFGPNENLSRAQLAQILYNREGRPSVTDSGIFADVDSGAWYAPAIVWASGSGIAGGYGDGTFGPNDPVTREQLAVMLWRYAGNPAATNKELRFADADSVSGYALEALRWAVENGIVSGMGGGVLDPKGLATRAQAAQMLKNFLDR